MGLLVTSSAGGYGLSNATAGVPFSISTPTEPTITSSVTATTATLAGHISAGAGNNGKRLTLESGSYGARTFAASDQEIILQSGAILGDIYVSGSRLKFRGETARVGTIGAITGDGNSADVYFYQCTITGGAGSSNTIFGDRYAFISNLITMANYSAYVELATDFIWGNNNSDSTSGAQSAMRFMDMNRTVVVDSRVRVSSHQSYRQHADTLNATDHYASRNQFEGFPGQILADGDNNGIYERLIAVTYTNNSIYTGNSGNFSIGSGTSRCEILTMTGNTMYSTGGVFPSQELPAWTVTPNTVSATTTAPAWNFA